MYTPYFYSYSIRPINTNFQAGDSPSIEGSSVVATSFKSRSNVVYQPTVVQPSQIRLFDHINHITNPP